ncbi:C-type lectin domain family 4 member F-like [Crassostrea virginica]
MYVGPLVHEFQGNTTIAKADNGHCYYLFRTKMNWFEAQIFCKKQKSQLLQINDQNENIWISMVFPNVRYWIDYTDIGKEGCWLTFSSGRDEYSSWYSRRPDGGRIQNCATNNYLSQLGRWDDVGCHDRYPSLCETSGSES